MGLFRSREHTASHGGGRSLIKKADDRGDLNEPDLPPCHPRNGGHDIHEVNRRQLANGRTLVVGQCLKCSVQVSETL